jgi:hypothetical protein
MAQLAILLVIKERVDVMKNEIFDLDDLNDLPEEVKKHVRPLGLRLCTMRLIDLFELQPQLSIDEIIVGLSRKYKINKSRSWVTSTIYNLKKRNVIRRVPNFNKLYEKVNEISVCPKRTET